MTNPNYRRGRAKEYREAEKLRKQGYEVMRTAGSHGTFDLIGINKTEKRIILAQIKSGESAEREAGKILNLISGYSGGYFVRAIVIAT